MLESARKLVSVAVPQVSVKLLFSVGSLAGFAWLLTQDRIHPFVVYLLQLYLAF